MYRNEDEPQYVERRFRREHLQQMVHGVRLVGPKDEKGTLLNRDDRGRYKIMFEMGVVTLAPSSVILPTKTSVMVVGLKQQLQYNNRLGTIVQVANEEGRYVVDFGGEAIAVKWENVLA